MRRSKRLITFVSVSLSRRIRYVITKPTKPSRNHVKCRQNRLDSVRFDSLLLGVVLYHFNSQVHDSRSSTANLRRVSREDACISQLSTCRISLSGRRGNENEHF